MRFTIATVIAFIAYTSIQSLAAPTPVLDSTKNSLHGVGIPGVHNRPSHRDHHRHRHHHHHHHHHKHAGVGKAAQKHPVEPRGLPISTPMIPTKTDLHAGKHGCIVGASGKDCPHSDTHHVHHHRKHRHRKDHGGHSASSHPSSASKKHAITNPSHSHRHHRKHGKHGHSVKKVNGSRLPSHSHRHHRKHGKHGKESSEHLTSPPPSPAPGHM